MSDAVRILHVEDQPIDATLAKQEVHKIITSCHWQQVDTQPDFLAALHTFQPDVIISNYQLPQFDGLQLLKEVAAHAPHTPVIILTKSINEATAVSCIKAGAADYIIKENIEYLGTAVNHALQNKKNAQKRGSVVETNPENEALLKKSQSVAKIGSYYLDVKTGLWISSQALDNIFGIDDSYPKDVTSWVSLIHPNHRVEMQWYLTQHVLIEHNRFDQQYQIIRHDDKEERWIHGLGEVELDETGQAIKMVGTIQDITKRKQAEIALKESEFFLRKSQSIAEIGSYYYDLKVNQWISSHTLDEIFGIDGSYPKDLAHWEALVHPDDREKLSLYFSEHVLTKQIPFDIEYRIIRQNDGHERWVHSLSESEVDKNGRTVKVMGTIQDITARKAAETQLRESEKRLQIFSNVTTEGIVFHHQGIILDINEAMVSMFGYQIDEIIGENLLDFVAPKSRELVMQKIIEQDEHPYEAWCLQKDGTIFPAEVLARQYEFQGEAMRVACLLDITERKQVEQERLDNLKFFESLDRINQSFQGANDIEQMMSDTLDEVLSIFGCDRAFLMYPCDPEAIFWEIPMERTRVEYPGVFEMKRPFPRTPATKEISKALLSINEPLELKLGQEINPDKEPWKTFEIKSVLTIALHPKVGKPWQFSLHQCSTARDWTSHEKTLFQAISRRLTDTLSTMIIHRDLQGSEERYREAQQIAQLGHWSFDMVNEKFLWCSEETFRLLALDPTQGNPDYRDFMAKVHPDDHANINECMARTMKSGTPLFIEYRIPLANGEIRILEAQGIAHRGADQQVERVTGTVMGITERKKAEAELQESEERLQQAVQVARIGTFDHDHSSNDIYTSSKYRAMWGWELDEQVQLSMLIEQIHPEDWERVNVSVQRAYDPAGDGFYDNEHRIIHRDGTVRWLSVQSQTFFAGEGDTRHPIRTVGVALDVTAAKQAAETQTDLEEKLRQAQKLESLGRLAGGIAHDFNNLLVPMIGYTELGQMKLPSDDKVYAYLEKIGSAAQRAANLTKQILAFSRRQMLEIELFDLNEIVSGIKEMLQRLIGEDVKLQIFSAPTSCPISADRTQVEQILLNLVINARDAMPNGGQLILETDTVYLDESYAQSHPDTEPGHYTMLSMSDTGDGMDSETQKQIFDPFFTTKAQGKGTGLGLATVFGIVKQHRGNIWVYSELNEGTTFKIYLPRPAGAAQIDAVDVPEGPSVYGTETVLVVEDEQMVRKLACETLATYGYTVLEAKSPNDGLHIATTHEGTIHLLLTDVIMPDMNGRQLYNKIIKIRPDLKVVYMSGYTDNVIVHHGVLDEGVDFIEKPFSIRHFGQKIRTVLD